jgi:hypothetical protein
MEEFYNKSGTHSTTVGTNINLMDFDNNNGTRPSKINILDMSPLQSPSKNKKKNEDNDLKDLPKETEGETNTHPIIVDHQEADFEEEREEKSDKENFNDIFNNFDFNAKMQEDKNKSENLSKSKSHSNSGHSKNNSQDFTNTNMNEQIYGLGDSFQQITNSTTSKNNICDINDLFDTLHVNKPREVTKIDKIKEIYNNAFTENETKKIDPIYNVFGGTSFAMFSPHSMPLNPNSGTGIKSSNSDSNLCVNIKTLDFEKKRGSSSSNNINVNVESPKDIRNSYNSSNSGNQQGQGQSQGSNTNFFFGNETVPNSGSVNMPQQENKNKSSFYPTFEDDTIANLKKFNPQKSLNLNFATNTMSSKTETIKPQEQSEKKPTTFSDKDIFNLFD